MKTKLAGRLSLQEAIAQTLSETKEKLASSRGDGKEEAKEKKLLAFEKKEHGHLPSVKEEKEECSKEASVIDAHDPDEVEKLAAALDEGAGLLVKEADSIENGGESKQGGEQLPTQSPTGGKQPYKHDKARHQIPTRTGMISPKDNRGASTAVPTDDNRAPGGTGAKYPAEGPLRKKGGVESLEAVVQAAIEAQGTGELLVEAAEVPEVEKQAFSVTEKGHAFDAEKAKHKKEYHENRTESLQKHRAVGYLDPDTHSNPARFRDVFRFNHEGVDHRVNARHQAYVEKKHKAGKNAYNPFGGTLTPTEKEEGGSKGMLGMYGRIGKHDTAKKALEAKEKKKESAAAPEPKETAVDFILGKLAKVENGGEAKQGGEQLANHAPVPSNPGRNLISSNAAPAKATKREAKAEPKRALKEVLTEPALSASTDSKVNENLRNASKGGVKIAAAKALLAKIAEEGCQCGGDKTCRHCKMKKAAAELKAKAEANESAPSAE